MTRRPVPLDRLQHLLDTPRGLTRIEAEDRRQQYGPNDIVETPPHPWRDLLRETTKDPMLWLFAGVGVVYALLGQRTEAVTLLAAILPLLAMDVYLHRRTQASTAGLRSRLATTSRVLRDDAAVTIPAADVVPGDLVMILTGEPFPADGLVVAGAALQVDESALTGESFPVTKRPLGPLPRAAADRPVEEVHWVFAGTRLLTGEGRVRVVYTGGETVYGQIVRSATHGAHEATPLQAAIGRLVRNLVVAATVACLGLAAVRLYQGHGWLDALVSAVTLATAAMPEEFPVVFAFFLGVGVYRMARRHALVRRAVTVENIGRVTCICTDKTGTITEGRLRLARLSPGPTNDEKRLLALAALASRGESGDPMDVAILEAAGENGINTHEVIATFPFTEDRKRESTIVRTKDGRSLVATKGAAEVVLAMSTLDAAGRAGWHDDVVRLADGAHKVLAVASRGADDLQAPDEEPETGFEFAGLMAFEDPVREGVREAVRECQSAGIHPIMVTGDHPATALAVARRVGIGGEAPRMLTGEELQTIVARAGDHALPEIDVVARATPAQKLMLVQRLQAGGEIVAVTGDGVNDVPALQSADIGVAMGERGTQSAREVAAIVLLDDNFRTIVGAIREGRQLFQNLRSSFHYLLVTHIPLVLTATLIPLVGYPLLYFPVHIVWLEITIHPTAMLAFQRPARFALARGSRAAGPARFFGAGEWATIVLTGVAITLMVTAGYLRSLEGVRNVEHGRAMALATFTVTGACSAAALSRLGTRASRILTVGTIVTSFVLIQTRALNRALHLTALHWDDWALVALAGLIAGCFPLLRDLVASRRERTPAPGIESSLPQHSEAVDASQEPMRRQAE